MYTATIVGKNKHKSISIKEGISDKDYLSIITESTKEFEEDELEIVVGYGSYKPQIKH